MSRKFPTDLLLRVTLLALHLLLPSTLGWTGEGNLDRSTWEASQDDARPDQVGSWQDHMDDHMGLLLRKRANMHFGPSHWKHASTSMWQASAKGRRRAFHSSSKPGHPVGAVPLAHEDPHDLTRWDKPHLPHNNLKRVSLSSLERASPGGYPKTLPAIRVPERVPTGQDRDTQIERDLVLSGGSRRRPTVPAPLAQRSRHFWERSFPRVQLRSTLKTADSTPIFVSQKDALALNGVAKFWKVARLLRSWVGSRPCSSWLGVKCNEDGRVIYLNLGGRKLGRSMPSQLAQLDKLQTLYLYRCNLKGPIPASLGNLTNLMDLRLEENRLSGQIPSNLFSCRSLQNLVLSSNVLKGTIPTSISNLVDLTNLDLYDNIFNGSIPSGIGSFNNLQSLRFGFNQLSGVIPPQLSRLSRLTNLGLAGNQLRGRIPAGLFNMASLQYIGLQRNSLEGSIPRFGNLVNLTSLYLSRNKLSGRIPSSISSLTQLFHLDLSRNALTRRIPASIRALRKLAFLSLRSNDLTGNLYFISHLVSLEFLSISENRLTGKIPEGISRLVRLKKIYLFSNKLQGNIPPGIGSLTALETLYLNDNNLQGSIPASIGNLKSLFDLSLSSNMITTSLPDEFFQLSELIVLDLSFLSLEGPLLPRIVQLKNIISLSLGATGLSESLPEELGQMAALEYLDLKNNLINGSIPNQLGQLKKLRYLYLNGNSLTGNIPPEFAGLELNFVNLGYNLLSGSVPEAMSNLTQLVNLNLESNQLSGGLDLFWSLTNLNSLALGFNQFSGVIGSSIKGMRDLQALYLQENDLEGPIPRAIGELTALTSLFLSNNNLTGTIPASLCNLRNNSRMAGLIELDLSHNRFYGSLPSRLTELNALSFLDVSFNFFTGPLPEFPQGQQISVNDFSNNYFTSGCPYGLFVDSNCISTPCNSPQKTDAACDEFCNALDPRGPCSGNGFCVLEPSVDLFVCNCFRGFATLGGEEADYRRCVENNQSLGGVPFIPVPNITEPQGISIQDPKFERMNKWSRYLSVRSRFSNRVVTWDIYAASTWMSPSEIFLGFNPTDANETVANVLSWKKVRDQDKCETCWAYAAADTVGGATTIARSGSGGDAVMFSIDNITQNITNNTCAPGFPTNALEYAIDKPLVPEAGNVSTSQVPPVVMYESVRFRGWFGLLLTLHNQPALIILDGSSPSFQDPKGICSYKAYVFNKEDCFTGKLGHSVVVTGYDLTAPTPYWVIRNSWGSGWCDKGFMRLGLRGGDGLCGMNIYPAYYPVPAPNEGDPCYRSSVVPDGEPGERRSLNPCGGGYCIPNGDWGPYGYECDCTVLYTGLGKLRRFVAVNNTVKVSLPNAGPGITQSCVPVDACELALKNPCQQGTCVNDGKGGYSCLCFPGFRSIKYSDGSPTCAAGEGPGSDEMYVVPGPQVTCNLLAATFNLSTDVISRRNKINCSLGLKEGDILNVSNPEYSCSIAYSVTFEDQRCSNIVKKLQPRTRVSRSLQASNSEEDNKEDKPDRGNFTKMEPPRVTEDLLKQLNPYIDCSSLRKGQMICLRGDGVLKALWCSKLYTLKRGETCAAIISRLYTDDPPLFYQDNPGIDCASLEDPSASSAGGGSSDSSDLGGSGQNVCVSATDDIGSGRTCPASLVRTTWGATGCTPQQARSLGFATVTAFETQNFPCNNRSPVGGAIICRPK